MTLQKLLANFRLFPNSGKVGNKIITTLSAISQRIVCEEGYSLEKRFRKDFKTSWDTVLDLVQKAVQVSHSVRISKFGTLLNFVRNYPTLTYQENKIKNPFNFLQYHLYQTCLVSEDWCRLGSGDSTLLVRFRAGVQGLG